MRKESDAARGANDAPDALDRSDEVAHAAEPQGDGAPVVEEVEDNIAGSAGGGPDLQEMQDRYLRLAAEYENFRKRSRRESADWGTRAQSELVKQLIDPLDDLSRFAHIDPSTVDAATVVQGVEMVERKILKALTVAGLEILNPVDEPFNPEVHEAVTTELAASPEDDHMISRVFQQGYRFGGQLLRPARVVVKQWNG